MTLAAGVLRGASGRLLAASVPLRFFVLAVGAHIAFWALLYAAAAQLAGFRGGFAPLLAAVHLLTIGVLLGTAIGAAVQILPVVTRRPLAAVWPVKLVFWTLLPGLGLLVASFYLARPGLAIAASAVVGAGLLMFVAVLGDNLRRAPGPPVVVAYGWAAIGALVATVLLGLRLVADFRWGAGPDHAALALGHLILGGFGCMGLLALGLSHVLVPMFTLAGVPDRRLSWMGFATATVAVALGAAGTVGPLPGLVPIAAALGVAACGLHLWLMRQALRDGMRRRLGLSFMLVRAAWAMQAATLATALACALGASGPRVPALFAVLLFAGWLLTFLLAVLQRILPMLVSMHVAAGLRQAPGFATDRVQELALRLHACCHALALLGVGVGVIADLTALVRLGSALGLIGACAFAVFALRVLRGLRRKAARAPPPAVGRATA